MTENTLRSSVTSQAKSWLGLCEPTTYIPILNCYNEYARNHGLYVMTTNDPWCAMFVSAVFIILGIPQITPIEVSCYRMVELAERRGLWIEDDNYMPSPGDIILYDWQDNGNGDNIGTPDHVGIVSGVNGDIIEVIEGNCSDSVKAIYRRRGDRYIRGYIIPDYASISDDDSNDILPDPEPTPIQEHKYHEHVYKVKVNLLKVGDYGPQVANMQHLLKDHNFYTGKIDGRFGDVTYEALKAFQRAAHIGVDGEWGEESFNAMWNYN